MLNLQRRQSEAMYWLLRSRDDVPVNMKTKDTASCASAIKKKEKKREREREKKKGSHAFKSRRKLSLKQRYSQYIMKNNKKGLGF